MSSMMSSLVRTEPASPPPERAVQRPDKLSVKGLAKSYDGHPALHPTDLAVAEGELLTVLGTSSSESALVPLMQKLERLGCSKSVVGLVVPSGYSFNLDGTNIYLTMASLFVAQALNIDLTLRQELTILGVAMLTSKGASGVTGAGFITLAATLAVVPSIPVAGLALLMVALALAAAGYASR